MKVRDFTRSRMLEILKADPAKSLRELCELVHMRAGNVMYHVRRLEKDGLITWQGAKKNQRLSDWHVKNAAMPKLSKAQLQARINAVVEKALADPQAAIGEDASLKVLSNGIKVIVRKPSLWGSRAHVG